MNATRPDLLTHTMKFGLIMGALFSVNFLLSTWGSKVGNALSYVVVGTIGYYTYHFTTLFRDQECEGVMSYGRGLAYVLLLYFFGGLISSVVKYVFVSWINPEFLPNLLNQSLLILENMNLPNTNTEMSMEMLEKMLSPVVYATQTLWTNLFIGLLVGLIVAAFTKKEKNLFEK